MVLKGLYIKLKAFLSYLAKYTFKSAYNIIEIILVILRFNFIFTSIISMSQPKIEPDENGKVEGLIEILSLQSMYFYRLKRLSSVLSILHLLNMYKFLKFSLLAYLPMNALYRSRQDLVNIFTILILFLIACSETAFLLFGLDMYEYSNIESSSIYVLSYVMGDYRLL